jgi:hypothetical protein
MRFWPFGKDEEAPAEIEYVSRVVAAKAKDGAVVRAKLHLVFESPVPEQHAERIVEAAQTNLRLHFEASASADLLGEEARAGAIVIGALGASERVRSADVVAIHVVGGSEPPRRARMPSAPFLAPAGAGPQTRRPSSTQMLAVRDSRLIPAGVTAEGAGLALVPLFKDAAIRMLVGVLRMYDLIIVRGVSAAGGENDLAEVVPVSSVAPGLFEFERRPELSRWEDVLGTNPLAALRAEAQALVCFCLWHGLQETEVEKALGQAVLESAARAAFPQSDALDLSAAYQAGREAPAGLLAVRALVVLSPSKTDLPAEEFQAALSSLLATIQADFTFAAEQVKIGRIRLG